MIIIAKHNTISNTHKINKEGFYVNGRWVVGYPYRPTIDLNDKDKEKDYVRHDRDEQT